MATVRLDGDTFWQEIPFRLVVEDGITWLEVATPHLTSFAKWLIGNLKLWDAYHSTEGAVVAMKIVEGASHAEPKDSSSLSGIGFGPRAWFFWDGALYSESTRCIEKPRDADRSSPLPALTQGRLNPNLRAEYPKGFGGCPGKSFQQGTA